MVGWQIQSRQTADLVCQALLIAVWRRKPKNVVLIHSIRAHSLSPANEPGSSMPTISSTQWAGAGTAMIMRSLRASLTCSNANGSEGGHKKPAQKLGRMSSTTSKFYNPVRKHATNPMLSPVNFERQQKTNNEGLASALVRNKAAGL